MRKTKIICTIGPASQDEATLAKLFKAGMNVARINFSHDTHDVQQKKMDTIKKVREEMGLPIAIMLDTKGPEYRIGTFEGEKAQIQDGQTFTFTTDDIVGDNTRVSVSYKKLAQELKPGDTILVSNGILVFEVQRIEGSNIICKVVSGGEIADRKSMNFPGHVMTGDFLSEQDKKDLLLGIRNDIDFVAASFVSSKKDVLEMREFLNSNGGEGIDIIAKIENQTGVDNIDEICEVADGIMVARGDLGVEIPFVEVPAVQKYLIARCRLLGKRVITATEMLESMIKSPRPTRAEISDVANAVYDGSSAVMLSGETAMGKHPVDAVLYMAQIAERTERDIDYAKRFRDTEFKIRSNIDAVSHATCAMAIDTGASAIAINSLSGSTVRMVSRFRCPVDIVGITTSAKACRKLNLNWGVTPVLSKGFESIDDMFDNALLCAKEKFGLKPGSNVVITGGPRGMKSGNTNTIRLESVK